MRQVRPSRGWWGIVALAGLWACETARNPSGSTFDLIAPVIQLTASADTQPIASGLQFTVTASDNLSLKDIQLTYSGGYIAQTDTVFTQATTTFNQAKSITFPANSGAGGRRALSPPVTVTVQTPGNDLTPPSVSHSISSRVEVNDNVTVHATDPSGISWIGFRVDTALNAAPPFTGIVALKVDTVNVSAGNLTTVDSTFALALPLGDSALPKSVVVRGYACDLTTARNCAYSQTSTVITGTAARPPALGIGALAGTGVDTVVVVAGITRPLPLGGHIADAIYNVNRRELYLTNDVLGRVEVFDVASKTFSPTGIVTAGPVPWGIALFPVDTLGHYDAHRIVGADAGGTELSILDASTRLLLWRQALPNFLIEKYSIVNVNGFTRAIITVHDVSDR